MKIKWVVCKHCGVKNFWTTLKCWLCGEQHGKIIKIKETFNEN